MLKKSECPLQIVCEDADIGDDGVCHYYNDETDDCERNWDERDFEDD